MTEAIYPAVTHELARMRRGLAPNAAAAFHDFSEAVFAQGALSTKMKHIIAVAVAHVTQCPYCITGHTRAAIREGTSDQELMEAIWIAAEMRAGAAFAHAAIAVAEMARAKSNSVNGQPKAASDSGEQRSA